jgi:hypothetical protein
MFNKKINSMKKYNFHIRFIVVLIIVSCLLSCEKQNEIRQDMRQANPQDAELLQELYGLSNCLAYINNDQYLKDFVYKEIERKFDGDYNVLLGNVEEEINQNYQSKKGEINLSLDFFKNNKLFPQIYIPNYDELKKRKILGKENPAILFYVDENETGEYPGFKMNNKGELIEIDFLLTESYANNNEVWVISINERVDEFGKPAEIFIDFFEQMGFSAKSSSLNFFEEDLTKGTLACTPPLKPGKVEAYPSQPYSIYLEWEDVSNALYYKIYRDINYSGNFALVKTIDRMTEGSAWTNSGLQVGAHYSYQVQSFNAEDCFSARTFSVGSWASWRTNNFNDILYQIYISDGCWSWCCGWPEGDIELMYRLVKYNKSDQQIEYPKNSLPKTSKSAQKGKWRIYNKELFRWDIGKYAYNYLLFFYEDDGGDDKGTTIKLSGNFKPTDNVTVGADISFTIDDRDEELGWIEIYHFDSATKIYSLSPRKGSASIRIRQ